MGATIEALTAKIRSDSEEAAGHILAEAKAQAAAILAEAETAIAAETEAILTAAEAEAARLYEQRLLTQQLRLRDQNLAAKGDALDAAFAAALARLEAMPREDFLAFVIRQLQDVDTAGQQIILPAGYGSEDLAAINEGLQAAGQSGDLTLSTEAREIPAGFVLVREGIEQNYTFEALTAYYRYELEGDVLQALY